MDNELIQETFKKLDKAEGTLRNWILSLEVIPNEYNERFEDIIDAIQELDSEIIDNDLIVLYSLKQYTEHRVSWEKAGSICGLGIFGLEEYCENLGVDRTKLRIDEYYGLLDVDVIKKEWDKLDPNGCMKPINYTGDSKILFKSDNEYTSDKLYMEHYTATAKYILTEFIILYQETISAFDEDYDDYKQSINYLRKISKLLKVEDKNELEIWINIIEDSYSLIQKALDDSDPYFFNECYDNIIKNIEDCYYFMLIKKEKE